MNTTATGLDAVALRDLNDEQFVQKYGADRFTISVLSSRMRYAVDHMCTELFTHAFSPILRNWFDFAATVAGPREYAYSMSTVSKGLALFTGTMEDAVRNTIEEFGPDELRPGDVIIANDPYRVGNHVNDLCFIRPLFHDGQVIGFVTLRAHQLDMGGITPAGFSGTKRNVYETGLVIPPMRLYQDDKPVRSTFNLIFDNARFSQLLLPDIKTTYQGLLLGERLVLESVERYGVDAHFGAIRYACDVSADAMRTALTEAIPDGVYEAEDGIDADGVDDSLTYRVKVKIVKSGGDVEIDLSGTSVQARTSVNASVLDTKTAIVIAFKMLIDQHTPFNSGATRNIDVVIPAGTFCSATPPDGPIFLYWESSLPVLTAVYRALAKALGAEAIGGDYGSVMIHNASGVLPDGTPWSSVAECGGEHGPWGATKRGDGDSYCVTHLMNNVDPAVEAIEAAGPIVLLCKEYVADTAGSGTNRGGAAVRKDSLYLAPGVHWCTPLHTKSPAGIGVNGGQDGTRQATWMFDRDAYDITEEQDLLGVDDVVFASATPVAGVLDPATKQADPEGEYFYFAASPTLQTAAYTTFRYLTGGGGGWGDPLGRDPERVQTDVRDEYITIDGAYRDYGVVVVGDPYRHPEQLVVDEEATRARRAELAGPR